MTDPDVKVSGDPVGGFIVEVHDGDRHCAFSVVGGDEASARAEGLRRFQAEAPEVESPPATVAHVESAVAGVGARLEAMVKAAEARIMAAVAPKPVPVAPPPSVATSGAL
jgi:uncharacterized protein YfcZ (UPF0381/DUF406 family)